MTITGRTCEQPMMPNIMRFYHPLKGGMLLLLLLSSLLLLFMHLCFISSISLSLCGHSLSCLLPFHEAIQAQVPGCVQVQVDAQAG